MTKQDTDNTPINDDAAGAGEGAQTQTPNPTAEQEQAAKDAKAAQEAADAAKAEAEKTLKDAQAAAARAIRDADKARAEAQAAIEAAQKERDEALAEKNRIEAEARRTRNAGYLRTAAQRANVDVELAEALVRDEDLDALEKEDEATKLVEALAVKHPRIKLDNSTPAPASGTGYAGRPNTQPAPKNRDLSDAFAAQLRSMGLAK